MPCNDKAILQVIERWIIIIIIIILHSPFGCAALFVATFIAGACGTAQLDFQLNSILITIVPGPRRTQVSLQYIFMLLISAPCL